MLIKKIIFYLIYFIVLYITLCIFIVFLSFIGIQKNYTFKYEPFLSNQIYLYHKGLRNIWQNNPSCVENINSALKYVPKIGACEFNNAEFRTQLNFTKNGRDQLNKITIKESIAFLGDSVTMGWGVNDHQTFSNIVESDTKIKTYNLGVSSYGTYRELLRLKQNENFKDIKKIFIQYHRNDIDENKYYLNIHKEENDKKVKLESANYNKKQFIFKAIKKSISNSYKYIFHIEKKKSLLNFTDHQYHLEKIINNFDLENKEIFIFYVNDSNRKFSNFPEGKLNNLTYFNIDLDKEDFYLIDDHPNPKGHKKIAEKIISIINM